MLIKISSNNSGINFTETLLWHFLFKLLDDPMGRFNHVIKWRDVDDQIFQILDTRTLSKMWGDRKNCPNMNYDKLSRSLRCYYKANILQKVPGLHSYQFLKRSSELIEDRVAKLNIKLQFADKKSNIILFKNLCE